MSINETRIVRDLLQPIQLYSEKQEEKTLQRFFDQICEKYRKIERIFL
jgi:hypothetical protein